MHLSVILFTGGSTWAGTPPEQVHPRVGTPLGRNTPPRTGTPPPPLLGRYNPPPSVHAGIRSTSGRYASYWNAFLLDMLFDFLYARDSWFPFPAPRYSDSVSMWNYLKMAEILVQNGATLDVMKKISANGTRALKSLLNPGEGYARAKVGRNILKVILQENALKPAGTIGTEIDLECSAGEVIEFPKFDMIPFVYEQGYRVAQVDEIHRKMQANTFSTHNNPVLRLETLCRLAVRRSLGSPLTKKLPQLVDVPPGLKDYLFMKEIDTLVDSGDRLWPVVTVPLARRRIPCCVCVLQKAR